MCYTTVLYHAWLYFPGREGLVSGIMLTGFGLGGLISTVLSSHYVNPNNVDPIERDKNHLEEKPFTLEVANNLPIMFKAVTNWFMIVIIISIILVQAGPKHELEMEYLLNKYSEDDENEENDENDENEDDDNQL